MENIAFNPFPKLLRHPESPADALDDLKSMARTESGFDEQKKLLAELLDNNQLCVYLYEIDDEDCDFIEDDKAMNEQFYGES